MVSSDYDRILHVFKVFGKSVGRITDHPDMTSAVWTHIIKSNNKNKINMRKTKTQISCAIAQVDQRPCLFLLLPRSAV